MSARRPLLLPVAGYGATFSPWPTSGPPRVWPILRRSCTGRRHNFPVFQTNGANEARHTRNRSPDRFGALVNLQTDVVEQSRNPWSQGSYSRNSAVAGTAAVFN